MGNIEVNVYTIKVLDLHMLSKTMYIFYYSIASFWHSGSDIWMILTPESDGTFEHYHLGN